LQVVARYASQAEAHLAQARLEAAGIESWIEGAHLSGQVGHTGGPGEVWLRVRSEDHDAARQALYEPEVRSGDDPELRASLTASRRRIRIGAVCVLVGLLLMLLLAIFMADW